MHQTNRTVPLRSMKKKIIIPIIWMSSASLKSHWCKYLRIEILFYGHSWGHEESFHMYFRKWVRISIKFTKLKIWMNLPDNTAFFLSWIDAVMASTPPEEIYAVLKWCGPTGEYVGKGHTYHGFFTPRTVLLKRYRPYQKGSSTFYKFQHQFIRALYT